MSDERAREIADLKARLAKLEDPPTAASEPAAIEPGLFTKARQPKVTGTATGAAWLLALAALGGLAVLVFVASSPSTTPLPGMGGAGSSADAPLCDQSWAEGAYIIARSSSLIKGEDVSSDGLVIVVRPLPWERLSLDQQKALGEMADCAIAGQGGYLTSVRFRYELSGSDLLRLDATDLYDLRKSGFGRSRTSSAPPRHHHRR